MNAYQTEFNKFRGSLETSCDFYNLDTNTTLHTELYRTSNKLCIEYKVTQRKQTNENYSNYQTLVSGYIEVSLTYNQFKQPVTKIYLAKIEVALKNILDQYFNVEEVEENTNNIEVTENNKIPVNEEVIGKNKSISPIQQIRGERWKKDHEAGVNYYLKNYSHLQIGDIIYINTQKELELLEEIDSDGIIRIFIDKEHNNKVKAIILNNAKKFYKKVK
jgi:hypothetical protein